MRVAILALQGAFIEHEKMLARLGVETFEVRQLRDWEQPNYSWWREYSTDKTRARPRTLRSGG